MEKNKLTVFYKKLSGNICRTSTGVQDLSIFPDLEEREAELIYGYLVIDYNPYVASQFGLYEVVTDGKGNPKIKLRDGVQEAMQI